VSAIHRVRLPSGARVVVEVGRGVEPDDTLATRRAVHGGASVPVAGRLRRAPDRAAEMLTVAPGAELEAGDTLADDGRGHVVTAPETAIFLAYDRGDGRALIAPLGEPEPILGHVRGEVAVVDADAIEIRIAGALVTGVGGEGRAVHGALSVAVDDPLDELRAGAIDVGSSGRILVGGSRASAESLTRARAMGVAGIVLGGILDKELRGFEATQSRRREMGGIGDDFAVIVLEGYGKVGLDVDQFAWFKRHDGHMASLFGADARLYVYDAGPMPARRTLPRTGDRVIAHRRPHAGVGGRLVRVLESLHATPAGIFARSGLVRFDDGRSAIVPLANLEATEPPAD
jgi:hypothetical protein